MATITSTPGNKCLSHNPIIYIVQAGDPNGATFLRVRIVATVTMSGASHQFVFSEPASSYENITFDISSAVRAVADLHPYAADTLNDYPALTHSITAYDDYLVNGEETSSTGTASETFTAYIGRLTDRERLTGKSPLRWSRKPSNTPEICFYRPDAQGSSDDTVMHLLAGAFEDQSELAEPVVGIVPVKKGPTGAANIFGIAWPQDGYEMRFINSLGVHENVFVRCLPSTEVNIKTDYYAIARLETLKNFSRGVTAKNNDYEQWRMSSGPLDRQWQQWWLHEPLMAKWAWLKVDGQWLPVHIVPEETTKGIDRSKADALTVEFTLRFDINGSPFA